MPSTRWLFIAVIAVYSTPWIKSVIAAELSDPLPVASNGWRPIVGTSQVKPPPFEQKQKQTISLTGNDHENRNKNEKHKGTSNQNNNNKGGGGNQVHINHHGSTGHHQKLHPPPSKQQFHKPTGHGAVLVTGKPALRHPVMNKLHAHMALSAKRHKPSKPPQSSSRPHGGLRDEIMAPAPSSAIGSYAFYNQGPLSIQNSQLGGKPYHSQGHIDFSNHFAFSNVNNDLVLPQTSHFNFGKHPNQNELQTNQYVFVNQNDEFTRNLVPPPPVYKPQGEKETIPKETTKIIDQSATISTPQFVFGGQKDLPENLILQLPPPYKFQQNIIQQQPQNPSFDLEITKEKFKEYHTTLAPTSFKTSTESFLDATKFTKPKEYIKTSLHGYEVTEEKEWNDHLLGFKHYSTFRPNQPPVQQQSFKYQQNIPEPKFHYIQQQIHLPEREEQSGPQFLPTPYSPNGPSPNIEHAFPTSPTQAEISTIYSEITQMNKKKPYLKYPEPTNYNIKEVATHFPFFEDKPQTVETNKNNHQQFIKETTTKKTYELDETDATLPYVKPTQQTTIPTRGITRRPGQRRRRPTRPTTEAIELNTDEVYETFSERTTEKPQRRRRPIKYRTTESPREETIESSTRSTISYRPKVTRPQPTQTITEEQFISTKPQRYIPSKINFQIDETPEETTKHYMKFNRPRDENKYRKEVFTEEQPQTIQDISGTENIEPTTEIIRNLYRYQEETPTEPKLKKRKRIRPVPPQTTELSANTNLNIPENELDYTTLPSNDEQSEESITIKEFYDFQTEKETTTILTTSPSTTTPTTTTTTRATTTTTEPTTTKSNRARRPIKYDAQRPRFSVKDYRQRLNQYMSTTTDTTKSAPESTVSSPRIRYPNRFKIPTTASAADVEDTTDQLRQRFVPKDPRHRQYGQYTTEASSEVATSEKTKTLSHRVRPFGRYRSTTEYTPSSTTTQRVSIKPNIFNNLKRPQHLSLRNRIYNKRNSTTTTEQNTEIPEIEDLHTEKTEVTIPYESAESKIEVTTQLYHEIRKEPDNEVTTRSSVLPTEITKPKISEIEGDLDDVSIEDDEAFMQLQRISDLTSSAHKQYNTPGLFKSVSPTSRRVPNYFTIATEDPILPIEAFFPNLNHKNDKQ